MTNISSSDRKTSNMAFSTKIPIMLGDEISEGLYDTALVFLGLNQMHPYVVASIYDANDNSWSSGSYHDDLEDAYCDMCGQKRSVPPKSIQPDAFLKHLDAFDKLEQKFEK